MHIRRNEIVLTATILFLSVVAIPKPAFAYIDPGSGSYILQIVIAGAMGLVFAIKLYWKRLLEFVKNVFKKKQEKE